MGGVEKSLRSAFDQHATDAGAEGRGVCPHAARVGADELAAVEARHQAHQREAVSIEHGVAGDRHLAAAVQRRIESALRSDDVARVGSRPAGIRCR